MFVVPPSPRQSMGCRVCRITLHAQRHDAHPDRVQHRHPHRPGGWDHRPEPVPLVELDVTERACDLCSGPYPLIRLESSGGVVAPAAGTDPLDTGAGWSACAACAKAVDAGHPDLLLRRALTVNGLHPQDPAASRFRVLHAAVLLALRPRRAVIVNAAWSHAPLPARLMPEARNRLADLLRSRYRLTTSVEGPGLRAVVANGLDRAVLYWADNAASSLNRHATTVLPPTNLRVRDLPARDGLLAWALPVGRDGVVPLDAVSWTNLDDRLQVTVYRTYGAGLSGHTLRAVRRDLGWLLPVQHVALQPGQPVHSTDLPAPLVTCALLLAGRIVQASLLPTPPHPAGGPQRTVPGIWRVHPVPDLTQIEPTDPPASVE